MTLDKNSDNCIPNKFPLAFQNGSFADQEDIESKIFSKLIKKIMAQKPGIVFIVERKGLNLFSPFIDTLLEKHTISSIKINKTSSFALEKRVTRGLLHIFGLKALFKSRSKKGILLTDAVNEGKDVKDINTHLKYQDTELAIVCGYLGNHGTKERLKDQYPLVDVEFVHIAIDDAAYWNEITRLTQISHTRIAPLDRDHCFHTYKYKNPLSTEQVIATVSSFFQNGICVGCNFDDDEIKPFESAIKSFTSDFFEMDPFIKKMSLIQSPDFMIEKLTVRLKIDSKNRLIRILSVFEVDVDLEKFLRDTELCSQLPYPCCKKMRMNGDRIKAHCIQCIENNLSSILLNGIDAHLSSDPIIRGYHIRLVHDYYPCNSF